MASIVCKFLLELLSINFWNINVFPTNAFPINNNFITLYDNNDLRIWSSVKRENKLIFKIENVFASDFTPDGKFVCNIILKNNYNYIHLIKTEDEYKYENFVYKKIENQQLNFE